MSKKRQRPVEQEKKKSHSPFPQKPEEEQLNGPGAPFSIYPSENRGDKTSQVASLQNLDKPHRQAAMTRLNQTFGNRYAAGLVSQFKRTPISGLVQRDIKDKKNLKLGEYKIDMTKVESAASKSGEKGTVEFKPNAKSPNAKKIRLLQIVKVVDNSTGSDYSWTGAEADRNKVQTSGKNKSYKTKKGETVTQIAKKKTEGQITASELYAANKATLTGLGVANATTAIPKGTTLTIPEVVAGYFVDHAAGSAKATPRATGAAAEVLPYYREFWPNVSHSQDGHKRGASIAEASLWDFPGGGSSNDVTFSFETVARAEEHGLDYGTLHWGFRMKSGTVEDENHQFVEGTSSTFAATVAEFNKFYKNPHTVVRGETLEKISLLYFGTKNKWRDIYKANKALIGADPDRINAGWKLKIPGVTK